MRSRCSAASPTLTRSHSSSSALGRTGRSRSVSRRAADSTVQDGPPPPAKGPPSERVSSHTGTASRARAFDVARRRCAAASCLTSWIVRGNHHDGWGRTAPNDPSRAWSPAEEAAAFRRAGEAGVGAPRRTIVLQPPGTPRSRRCSVSIRTDGRNHHDAGRSSRRAVLYVKHRRQRPRG
jgi:hypothetical protein